jgi:hypothetical protein
MDLKIAARESITVPAGTFEAFRIEWTGINRGPNGLDIGKGYNLLSPQIRNQIAGHEIWRNRGSLTFANTRELVSFKQL